MFNAKQAKRDLRAYRRKGATGATRRLLAAIRPRLDGAFSLLDIGSGVGVIQHELANEGATSIVAVDASAAYLASLDEEAQRRGYRERLELICGDFTDVHDRIGEATIVTLDKVICCYPHMQTLVAASAAKAQRLYAVVVPRDAWWTRGIAGLAGWVFQHVFRWPFRGFVHSHAAIDRVCSDEGLGLVATDRGLLWWVRVYERPRRSR